MEPSEVQREAPPRLSVALRDLRRGFGAGVGPSRTVRELRRFVPSSLVERIDRGERLDLGEIRVAVLSGELRGFSSYAVQQRPREAFAALNRCGEELAQAVRECGGELCEFGGEGLVAVFGHTGAGPGLARSALAAAQWICRTAERDVAVGLERHLGAAFGIATGMAYVGGIRAGDRIFWSVVGDAAKRASRLRRRARELGVAVALDEGSRGELGDVPGMQRSGSPAAGDTDPAEAPYAVHWESP